MSENREEKQRQKMFLIIWLTKEEEYEEQQALINDHTSAEISAFRPNGYPFQTLQTFWS